MQLSIHELTVREPCNTCSSNNNCVAIEIVAIAIIAIVIVAIAIVAIVVAIAIVTIAATATAATKRHSLSQREVEGCCALGPPLGFSSATAA